MNPSPPATIYIGKQPFEVDEPNAWGTDEQYGLVATGHFRGESEKVRTIFVPMLSVSYIELHYDRLAIEDDVA